jgi:hypothetical protein
VQRIDLRAALAVILNADHRCEIEQRIEARLEVRPVGDPAADIANDAPEPRAQELELPPHALELMLSTADSSGSVRAKPSVVTLYGLRFLDQLVFA